MRVELVSCTPFCSLTRMSSTSLGPTALDSLAGATTEDIGPTEHLLLLMGRLEPKKPGFFLFGLLST